MSENQTEIATLGEFGLIKKLTESVKLKNASSLKGVGDDAAVLDYQDKLQLVTTDLLLEGIHFDLTYVPLKHLGYKAAVVNFSDIYAMNGTPKQITVSIGVSKRFTVEHIQQLYEGINLACEVYGVDLVGGDTSASITGLIISITCIGEGEKGKIVYRDGAKENDLICVSGDLGAAYMGLQLLERERVASAGMKDFNPDFSGKDIGEQQTNQSGAIERTVYPASFTAFLNSISSIVLSMLTIALPLLKSTVAEAPSILLIASCTRCAQFEQCIPSMTILRLAVTGPFRCFSSAFSEEWEPPQQAPSPLKCFTLPFIAKKRSTMTMRIIRPSTISLVPPGFPDSLHNEIKTHSDCIED